MNHWSVSISGPLLVLVLALWGWSCWLCWANWRRSGHAARWKWLEFLRLFAITCLTLTLLRPEFVRQIQRTTRPEIAVLCDASGSMLTRDVVSSNEVVSRRDWVEAQKRVAPWKSLESQAKVIVQDFSAPPTNTTAVLAAAGTDLDQALENTLQRERNLKAVLLLTDGDWNVGKPPLTAATRFREQNIPVFSVAIGRETPLPDLVLEEVSAPAYGLFGEQIAIPFRVRSYLAREVRTKIALWQGQREDTSKEIVIPAQGEVQDSILYSPRAVGEVELRLRLPVEPDESLSENNEKSFRINVRVDTLKVLVVDSLPRWEYRYLRNALARDPGVEMNCILFQPGLGMGSGSHYLSAFPNSKEAISRFDVIFLGDVGLGENELSAQDLELVRGLVEQQGSGLVFLPGRRSRERTLVNSPLKDLLPVVLDEAKPEGVDLQNESTLVLTSLGRHHLLTRLDDNDDLNEELWKQLPGFFWSAAVEKARPGSDVLAVHSSLRNAWGRMPLLVTRSAGNGKVLFMGTDSAWRWRRGVEDKYHYRFWSQVVRWMAHQRHLSEQQGMRLTYSPETPQAGDTVFLQATVLDAAGFPVEQGNVTGSIRSPSGRTERLDFTPVEGGWGVFKSSFSPGEGGTFQVNIECAQHGRHLDTHLTVLPAVVEKQGRPINAQVLRDIGRVTQGGTASFESLNRVIQEISLLPQPKPLEERMRLWSNPWWGGFLLCLLAVYWTGRKLAGMV